MKSARPAPIIGFAKAETPLLEKPLEGPVYLRTGPGHKLPDIVAALNGQIDIALDGHVDSVHGRHPHHLRNRPRRSRLQLHPQPRRRQQGPPRKTTPTSAPTPSTSTADIAGQNGKTANQNPVLQHPCGKKHKRGHARPS